MRVVPCVKRHSWPSVAGRIRADVSELVNIVALRVEGAATDGRALECPSCERLTLEGVGLNHPGFDLKELSHGCSELLGDVNLRDIDSFVLDKSPTDERLFSSEHFRSDNVGPYLVNDCRI